MHVFDVATLGSRTCSEAACVQPRCERLACGMNTRAQGNALVWAIHPDLPSIYQLCILSVFYVYRSEMLVY